MSQVTTVDIAGLTGSDTFPVNANDVYDLVETIAVQNIRAVKSSNRIEDAFYDYVVENGAVIEEAIIEMANKQAFVKTGAPDLSPKDPNLDVKYFNNWEAKQFETTIRRSDIRKIIADKGTGFDEVVSAILATLSEGEGYDDYKAMRDILNNKTSVGYNMSATGGIFDGFEPKNMKGVIYCMREMYNALKATNNFQHLIGKNIGGIVYSDFKIVCTKSGIIPQISKYGFREQMSDWRDFVTTGNPLQNYAYVYYNRNLYLCTGTTEGVNADQGKVDVDNPPTHTEGTEICGTVYLQWIGKLGMAKLVGIE